MHRELQVVGHPHVHQLEVGLDEPGLLAQRRRRIVQAGNRRTQVGDQAAQGIGGLRRAGVDQGLHIRERIEEEVRRDLRLQ
jgi:hypothetical protein